VRRSAGGEQGRAGCVLPRRGNVCELLPRLRADVMERDCGVVCAYSGQRRLQCPRGHVIEAGHGGEIDDHVNALHSPKGGKRLAKAARMLALEPSRRTDDHGSAGDASAGVHLVSSSSESITALVRCFPMRSLGGRVEIRQGKLRPSGERPADVGDGPGHAVHAPSQRGDSAAARRRRRPRRCYFSEVHIAQVSFWLELRVSNSSRCFRSVDSDDGCRGERDHDERYRWPPRWPVSTLATIPFSLSVRLKALCGRASARDTADFDVDTAVCSTAVSNGSNPTR
jgi:hypothetical protein